MACTPTPTQTLYEVLTTTTDSTSITSIVSTIPPVLSTFLTTFCVSSTVDLDGNTTCLSTQTTDGVTVIREEEVTTIPSQIVLQVTLTESEPTSTLFGTCPSSLPPTPPPGSLNTTEIVSQSASTLPNGSVVVSWVTHTSTLPPTWSVVPTAQGGDGNSRSTPQEDLGPIIGGALGGFVGLVLLSVLVWFIWRKRDNIKDMYPKDQVLSFEPSIYPSWSRRDGTSSPPPESEPKPYQYGSVGRRAVTPSRDSSPSTSPAPTRPQSLAFTGLSPNPYSSGLPYGPATPNSGIFPSPHSATFSQSPLTPNANNGHASSPFTPAASATPATPPQPSQIPTPPPLAQPSGRHPMDSVTSLGTAVSYPYPILPPLQHDGQSEGNDESRTVDRRPIRLSLTLANCNPETDGELFPRASEDDGRADSVRHQRPSLR